MSDLGWMIEAWDRVATILRCESEFFCRRRQKALARSLGQVECSPNSEDHDNPPCPFCRAAI